MSMKGVQEAADDAASTTHAPLFYSVTEARRMLGGIGVTKFYQLRAAGRIRTCSLGTRTLVHADELHRFAAEVVQDGEA